MNAQYTMFDLPTYEDTANAISSPVSACGPTLSDSPAGPTTAKSGPDPVPVSPSARPAKAKRSTTKGIFGQSGFQSSKHDDLSFALASRLRPRTDLLGSTLFKLTWTVRITPAGRSICALRASGRPIKDSGFSGWPTWPTPSAMGDTTGGGSADQAMKGTRPSGAARGTLLKNTAMLSGWPTTTGQDGSRFPSMDFETPNITLNHAAVLAAWATPNVPNGGRIRGNTEDIGKKRHGSKAQIGLENQAVLCGWRTPTACSPNSLRGKGQEPSVRIAGGHTVNLQDEVRLTAFGETPIGFLLGRNGWEIVPASGQLNPGHSRWLQGLPPAWDDSMVMAMRSMPKSRRRS